MPIDDPREHPVNELIRVLVRTGRALGPGEIERIIDRMATAPFDPRVARVSMRERGLTYHNRLVQAADESLFVHLVRRVLIDDQWAAGTTADRYLDDLRRAVRARDARLVVYSRRSGYLAATLTPTDRAVPARWRGPRSLRELLVVYSADRGIILTAYQVSNPDVAGFPKDARWLA